MLFEIDHATGALVRASTSWIPKELELERHLIERRNDGVVLLDANVFGEPLLVVRNQVQTRANKRADILALDRSGNGVVVELKRHSAPCGVETQALQYLADFSRYRGSGFLKEFSGGNGVSEEQVLGFIGGNARREEINRSSRIILVARAFDETLFSMGEWLCSRGVAFRCITYFPIELDGRKFLSFSVAFDRSPEAIYNVTFDSAIREPGIYWHNIARSDENWWQYLLREGQIPACFENAPGDQGEKLLARYHAGDRIVAFAKGYGAIGWGVIENPKYRLLNVGENGDVLHGECRHRLSIAWKHASRQLSGAMPVEEIRRDFGIYHPISTSVSMETASGERLIQTLSERWPAV